MSKASEKWVGAAKFNLLGLVPPADSIELMKYNDCYVDEFLIPATYMVTGMSREEFDKNVKGKNINEVMACLSTKTTPQELNTLISALNGKFKSPVWMAFLPHLVDYYKYDGLVKSSLDAAVNKYMETHRIVLQTYSADTTDIAVVLDENGVPIDPYPKNGYTYTQEEIARYHIKHGTKTVNDLISNQLWWKLNDKDKELLAKLPFITEDMLATYPVPVIEDGKEVEIQMSYMDTKRPPNGIMEILHSLPSALVESAGSKLKALFTFVSDNPLELKTEAETDYVKMLSQSILSLETREPEIKASVVNLPSLPAQPTQTFAIIEPTDDLEEALREQGYMTTDMSDAVKGYLEDYELSPDITVSDLLKFMEVPEDDPYKPVPFDKDKYKTEVINNIDWSKIEDDVKSSIDREAIVHEELSKIGVDADTLGRIKIAMSTGSTVELNPAIYADKFDRIGAAMLHSVREHLSADDSFDSKVQVQDVIYAFLMLLMADDKNMPAFLERMAGVRDRAKDRGKEIIVKAMEELQ